MTMAGSYISCVTVMKLSYFKCTTSCTCMEAWNLWSVTTYLTLRDIWTNVCGYCKP